MNQFIIADPEKCIGCHTCEVACVIAHQEEDSSPLSAETFIPRINVIKDDDISTAVVCRQCESAPCMSVCPNQALIRDKKSIQFIAARCIGCKTCVVACPFGAIEVITHTRAGRVRSLAYKCDLCSHLSRGPSCIQACPTNALQLITGDDITGIIRQRQLRTAMESSGGIHA